MIVSIFGSCGTEIQRTRQKFRKTQAMKAPICLIFVACMMRRIADWFEFGRSEVDLEVLVILMRKGGKRRLCLGGCPHKLNESKLFGQYKKIYTLAGDQIPREPVLDG